VSSRLLFVSCAVLLALLLPVAAQQREASDLDAFMARVIARRDDNWKRMQQYVLDERETFQILGPGGTPFYGFRREYLWFPRDGDGVFVRSPLTVDGVKLGEAERRKAEADYLRREERRDKRREDREKTAAADDGSPATEVIGDGVRQALEPGFVSAAYFLKFKFDPGQYALAGRVVQTHDFKEGVNALLIEKHNEPKWDPATPEGVTDDMLDELFAPLPADQQWTPFPETEE